LGQCFGNLAMVSGMALGLPELGNKTEGPDAPGWGV